MEDAAAVRTKNRRSFPEQKNSIGTALFKEYSLALVKYKFLGRRERRRERGRKSIMREVIGDEREIKVT